MTVPIQPAVPEKLGAYEILEPIATPDGLEHYLGVTVVDFVALTVLRVEPSKAAAAAKEIARSARVASTIAGEHVVRTFRAEREGDVMFLVSQHMQGRWLQDILSSAGKPEPSVAIRLLLDVAAGLDSIHGASAVHGDVRPATVLVCDDGLARLALLGAGTVAPLLELTEAAKSARQPYRAPEELRGRAASQAGDLYSFGILLHALLVGTAASGKVEGDLRGRGMPDALAGFLPRLLSHTASARPTSARVVIDVLEEVARTITPAPREKIAEIVAAVPSRPPPPPSLREVAPVSSGQPLQVGSSPASLGGPAFPERPPVLPPVASVAKAPPPVPADAARIAMATPPPPPRSVSVARPPPRSVSVARPPPPTATGGTPIRYPPPPTSGGTPVRRPPPPPAPSAGPPAAPLAQPERAPSRGDRSREPGVAMADAATTKKAPTPVVIAPSDADERAQESKGKAELPPPSEGGTPAGVPVATRERTISWAGAPAAAEEAKKDGVGTKGDAAVPAASLVPSPLPDPAPGVSRLPVESKTKVARTPVASARRAPGRGVPAWALVLLTLAAGAAIGAWIGLRERATAEQAERDAGPRRLERAPGEPATEPGTEVAPVPIDRPVPAVPTPASTAGGAPAAGPADAAPANAPTKAGRAPTPPKRAAPVHATVRPGAPAAAGKAGSAGTLQISCRRPCQVRIDGAASAQATTSGARILAGSHAVVVTDSQTHTSRTLRVYVPAGVTVRRVVAF